jgi:hypothetical protein
MRSIALLAVITALSATAWSDGALAMPLASPSALSLSSADAPLLEQVANICGISGCSPVWTKRYRKPPPNFVKLAAPLVVAPPQPRNAAPIAPTK